MIPREVMAEVLRDQEIEAAGESLVRRDCERAGRCVCLTGLRRSGKTVILEARRRALLDQRVKPEAILSVALSDERLYGITAAELPTLLGAKAMLAGGAAVTQVLLDDVEATDGWAAWARALADAGVSVWTALGRRLTPDEAATLGDAFDVRVVRPFCFREFLAARGVTLRGQQPASTAEKAAVAIALEEHLRFGGLPDVLRSMNKLAEINGVIKPVLRWDVVRRHGFRAASAAAALLRAIARARLAPVSVNALVRQAAADGVAMSAVTAGRYLLALEEAFVVEALPNFYGVTKGKALPLKYVFGDTGILASYLANDDAALCENAVALELLRRYGEGCVGFYADGRTAADLYVPSAGLAVGMVPSLARPARELEAKAKSMLRLRKCLPGVRLLLLSREDKGEITVNGTTIPVQPAEDWLLESSGQA